MIDPVSLSVAALVAKTIGGAAEEAGRGAADSLGRLIATVQERLTGSHKQALTDVELAPTDESKVHALAAAIEEHVSTDQEFRRELEELVAEASQDPQIGQFVTEVRDNAQVGKVVNISHARDVSF